MLFEKGDWFSRPPKKKKLSLGRSRSFRRFFMLIVFFLPCYVFFLSPPPPPKASNAIANIPHKSLIQSPKKPHAQNHLATYSVHPRKKCVGMQSLQNVAFEPV